MTIVENPDDFGNRPAWQERARCRSLGPERFFTERGESTAKAKAICFRCTVREACLEYALAHTEKFGIWGGMSERERRRIRTQRRKKAV